MGKEVMVVCAKCTHSYNVDDAFIGQFVACPKCKGKFYAKSTEEITQVIEGLGKQFDPTDGKTTMKIDHSNPPDTQTEKIVPASNKKLIFIIIILLVVLVLCVLAVMKVSSKQKKSSETETEEVVEEEE